jgi:hypothetical protein
MRKVARFFVEFVPAGTRLGAIFGEIIYVTAT